MLVARISLTLAIIGTPATFSGSVLADSGTTSGNSIVQLRLPNSAEPSTSDATSRSVTTNGVTANTTNTVCTPLCYYYNEEGQYVRASGASVNAIVSDPAVGPHDDHSLAEIALTSPTNSGNVVELGWMVAPYSLGDTLPHLFVNYWINGNTPAVCASGCDKNFIKFKPTTQEGAKLPVGNLHNFKITYRTSPAGWYMTYDGQDLGYYPESIWSGSFTSAGLVQVWGEVAASEPTAPDTQMGNGKYGNNSTSDSASFNDFTLIGSSMPGILGVNTKELTDKLYSIGSPTTTGFHYGGPGAYGPAGQKTTAPTPSSTPKPTPAPTASPQPAFPGDVNGDGKVNALDLSVLLSFWGSNAPTADLNHDGTVNVLDLSIVLAHYSGS